VLEVADRLWPRSVSPGDSSGVADPGGDGARA
jgi:hypothetical protein